MSGKWANSQVIQAAKAMVRHKLGNNFYDCEELSGCLLHMQESLKLWKELSPALQLSFGVSIQDVYNMIGIVMGNREDVGDALKYLDQATETYHRVVAACSKGAEALTFAVNTKEGKMFFLDVDKIFLTKFLETSKNFFGSDLDPKKIERALTQTYFYEAQVFSKANNVEKGIEFSAKTLERQLKSGEYQLKDFCVNCVTLGDYFTNVG